MKPAPFDYTVADSVEGAVEALARGGEDAKVLAGGQSLVPMLNFRLNRPTLLVDVNRIPSLAGVEEAGKEAIRVGALTRHHALETDATVARRLPALHAAMGYVAHLAVRNRGTTGGSLSHADPAAELPMMARLLDARITTASPSGGRTLDAGEFFLGPLFTALEPDELVTSIELAVPAEGHGWDFQEVARCHGDFALAAIAVTLALAKGKVGEARIAMMGVGETPLRAPEAEAVLAGQAVDEALAAEAAEAVRGAAEPMSDLHASSEYRRHLIGVLARRAGLRAWERANGREPEGGKA